MRGRRNFCSKTDRSRVQAVVGFTNFFFQPSRRVPASFRLEKRSPRTDLPEITPPRSLFPVRGEQVSGLRVVYVVRIYLSYIMYV